MKLGRESGGKNGDMFLRDGRGNTGEQTQGCPNKEVVQNKKSFMSHSVFLDPCLMFFALRITLNADKGI